MPESSFTCLHRVTYGECTVGDHVYYGRYLEWLEAARGELFRHIGRPFLDWQNQDVIFPVTECRLRYKSPARYDDEIRLEIWPTRLKGVRMHFEYRATKTSDILVLEAQTQHACTTVEGKPRRLPETLIAALDPLLRPPSMPASE